jgi:hypothetical protein
MHASSRPTALQAVRIAAASRRGYRISPTACSIVRTFVTTAPRSAPSIAVLIASIAAVWLEPLRAMTSDASMRHCCASGR